MTRWSSGRGESNLRQTKRPQIRTFPSKVTRARPLLPTLRVGSHQEWTRTQGDLWTHGHPTPRRGEWASADRRRPSSRAHRQKEASRRFVLSAPGAIPGSGARRVPVCASRAPLRVRGLVGRAVGCGGEGARPVVCVCGLPAGVRVPRVGALRPGGAAGEGGCAGRLGQSSGWSKMEACVGLRGPRASPSASHC